jgi:hypothetical protein
VRGQGNSCVSDVSDETTGQLVDLGVELPLVFSIDKMQYADVTRQYRHQVQLEDKRGPKHDNNTARTQQAISNH